MLTVKNSIKKIVTTIFVLCVMWLIAPASEAKASIGELDWQWPVPTSNTMSSCYLDGRAHYAIDILGNKGDEIYASYPGEVIATYSSSSPTCISSYIFSICVLGGIVYVPGLIFDAI